MTPPNRTPLERFVTDPTPGNAVALAIADHMAQPTVDWDYLTQLMAAEAVVRAMEPHTLTDDAIRIWWRSHHGHFYGPVPTVAAIPEAALFELVRTRRWPI